MLTFWERLSWRMVLSTSAGLFGISGSRQKPVTEDVRWAGALAGAYRDSSEMFPLQHESEIYLQQMEHEQKLAY